MRSTSLMAYTELDIPKAARAVLNYIKCSGPINGRAVSRAIPGGHKRLSWLKQNGLAENCGTTKDPITGRIAYLWKATNQPMFKVDLSQPKRKPRKELEAENIRLTEMLTQALYRSSAAYDAGYAQAKMEDGVACEMLCE